ncbi:MAG: hypothetical protein HQL06_03735 [Nitrospirae bacterium]|nr:hypothetical protein [Nitrospirota bacterium]
MHSFKGELLKSKIVSVWGIGYLGYTKIIKLQSKGFKANVYDLTGTGFKEKSAHNDYPNQEQIYDWSERGDVPAIDFTKVFLVEPEFMFNSNVHILAFPVAAIRGKVLLDIAAKLFVQYKDKAEGSLVIFQSAGTPGFIDKHFIEVLQANNVNCSFASAFRNDWTVEDFLLNKKRRIIAGSDLDSLNKAICFYDILNIKYETLLNIKEAEIYESAKIGIQYATTVFINQIAMAYPHTNIRSMVEYLLEDIELKESHLSIGAGGYKIPFYIQNILEGSQNPNALSVLQEVHNVNFTMIITYGDAIKRHGIKSVVILGLSARSNQKNIALSPSVILSEYLSKSGVRVSIDDPFYDESAIKEILPLCEKIDIFKDRLECEALFVMTDHNKYRFITQEEIDFLGISKISLIVDNVALFKDFMFSPNTKYHTIGDGNVMFLQK